MCIIYTEYKTIDYRQTVHVVDAVMVLYILVTLPATVVLQSYSIPSRYCWKWHDNDKSLL